MAESCAECSAETGLFLAEIVLRFSTSKLNSGDVPEDNQTDYVTISNYCGEAGVAGVQEDSADDIPTFGVGRECLLETSSSLVL